ERFEWLFIITSQDVLDSAEFFISSSGGSDRTVLTDLSTVFNEEGVRKSLIVTTNKETAEIFQKLKNKNGYCNEEIIRKAEIIEFDKNLINLPYYTVGVTNDAKHFQITKLMYSSKYNNFTNYKYFTSQQSNFFTYNESACDAVCIDTNE